MYSFIQVSETKEIQHSIWSF